MKHIYGKGSCLGEMKLDDVCSCVVSCFIGEIWSSPKALLVDTGLMALPKLHQRGHILLDVQHPHHPSRGCLEFFSQMFLCLYLEMSSDQISSSDLHTNFLHVFVQPFSCVFGLNYFLQT